MKDFYDRKKADACPYKIGDKVWLEGTNLSTTRPSKKLNDKCYGPFTIEKKEGPSSYQLTLPPTWKKIHPIFNESLLTPFHKPQFPSQQLPEWPPPVLVNSEEEYKVKEVLDSRMHQRKLQYLVKWKGYSNHVDWTWEPEENLKNSPKLIKVFHTLHPNTPRHIPTTLRFHHILKDNIPVFIPRCLCFSTGQIFDWEDGVFKQHN